MWNHRRRALLQLLAGEAVCKLNEDDKAVAPTDECPRLLKTDLEFILPLILQYPKCYWIWNHRLWLLQHISACCAAETTKTYWQEELDLVSKMLTRDSRNFHGWSYRRLVVAALRKVDAAQGESELELTEQEMVYTTIMIEKPKGLSNFSAWHQRSKLMPRLLDEQNADHIARRKAFDEELAKVEDALYIDPPESSLWHYHQYLMTELVDEEHSCYGTFSRDEREGYLLARRKVLDEMLQDYGDDCKWIYQALIDVALKSRRVDKDSTICTQAELSPWLDRLQAIDPLRQGRWDDLRSRLEM